MENLDLNKSDEMKLYINKQLFKDNSIFSEYEIKKIMEIISDMVLLFLYKKDINPYDVGIYIKIKKILVDLDDNFIHKKEFEVLNLYDMGIKFLKEVLKII